LTDRRKQSENALVRSGPAASTRVDQLRELLLDAGLADRVRVGAPGSPPGVPAVPRTHRTKEGTERPCTPGAEEAFSPDALLRPSWRGTEGRLIELSGGPSSGKTALAQRMAAGATARGELVGWVDLPNALDPRFLRRAGVRLEDVLWVRPPDLESALRAGELLIKTGFALLVLDLDGATPRALAQLGASVWTRLLRALRQARATAVLLGTQRAAGSFATLGVAAVREHARFDRGLFEGLESRLDVLRNRSAAPDGRPLRFAVHQRA
jgi:hypothetical protein